MPYVSDEYLSVSFFVMFLAHLSHKFRGSVGVPTYGRRLIVTVTPHGHKYQTLVTVSRLCIKSSAFCVFRRNNLEWLQSFTPAPRQAQSESISNLRLLDNEDRKLGGLRMTVSYDVFLVLHSQARVRTWALNISRAFMRHHVRKNRQDSERFPRRYPKKFQDGSV